jgi:hypothetical protein
MLSTHSKHLQQTYKYLTKEQVGELSCIQIKPVYEQGKLKDYFVLTARKDGWGNEVEYKMKLHRSETEYPVAAESQIIDDNKQEIIFGITRGGYRNKAITLVRKFPREYGGFDTTDYPKQNPVQTDATDFNTIIEEDKPMSPADGRWTQKFMNTSTTDSSVKNYYLRQFNTNSASYKLWLNSLPEE